jgi:hypothetical protein
VHNEFSTMHRIFIGEWRYNSIFLDIGIKWRTAVSLAPQPLYPRENSPRYPLNRRLSVPHSRSGLFGKKSCYCQDSSPGRPARCPSLNRLCYPHTHTYRLYLDAKLECMEVYFPAPLQFHTVVPRNWGNFISLLISKLLNGFTFL